MNNFKDAKEKINQDIRASQVRLLDIEGKALGIFDIRQALQMAKEQEVDLIEVVANAQPPVCKLMDFNKFLYEKKKKEKEQQKSQHNIATKEMRFNPQIGDHDLEFKVRHLQQFLKDGHRIKISVQFKGRMMQKQDIGKNTMTKILEKLEGFGKIEREPKLENRDLIAYLTPNK